MRFEIGQKVWWAHWNSTESSVECPDCGGTGRIRVTFHDETTVSIDCQRCSRGYEPPTGRLTTYVREPSAELVTITGFEFRDGKMEWQTSGSYCIQDEDLFENEAPAIERCEVLAAEANARELEQIAKKEKDTRSWAWNASYHRREIKEAKRKIEYHTKKLAAANLKLRKS